MLSSRFFIAAICCSALAFAILPARSHAATLELALVIDGSSSISADDWSLQIGAYQNIFQDDFYSNFVQPSIYDNVVVAAYVFSAQTVVDSNDNVLESPVVTSYLDWTFIDSDSAAAGFGAGFASLAQPGGQTNTSAAITIATAGGPVGCLVVSICNVSPSETRPGLLNNSFIGDAMVIDISTDGVPTQPTGGGTPNPEDRALAIAAADAARSSGITVNAIGVGDGIDAAFLRALVGTDPAASPAGFFVQAGDFSEFDEALREKIARETAVVPGPAAGWLLLTGITGLAATLRRRRQLQA